MEYADDHIPANKQQPPLKLPTLFIPPPPREPAAFSIRAEAIAAAITVMRRAPKRERFAKAKKLNNYALALERAADSGEGQWAPLRQAAAELRGIAEALRE